MKYYTDTVPKFLWQSLKSAGMPSIGEFPNIDLPTYAEVLDWLMDKGIAISMIKTILNEQIYWDGIIDGSEERISTDWHIAINDIIEEAVKRI